MRVRRPVLESEPIGTKQKIFLDFDGQTRRDMRKMDAGGGLIDMLAAGSAGANIGFFEIGFPQTALFHALDQFGLFPFCDAKMDHGCLFGFLDVHHPAAAS